MMGRYQREWSVALAYFFLLLALAFSPRNFFQVKNLRDILVTNAPVLVAAVGMTLVILTRHIDISVGSQFSLCGVMGGLLAQQGLPMPFVVLGTLLAGAGVGAVNGILVAVLNLPSIVVTLATLVILRETLAWWLQGENVRNLPESFQWFGLSQDNGQWLIVAMAFAVFAMFALGLRFLAAGRAVYATGSDVEAARLVGIRPRRVVLGVFTVMGMLSGLAALLNAVRFVDVDPKAGTGLELQVIAAVVVGGVAISGGRGTLIGPLIGVALIGTIGPALVFLGSQAQWDKAIQGTIILAAVASDALKPGGRKQEAGNRGH